MKKLLLFALLLRIVFSFFISHPDTIDFLGWSKDIEKNGLIGVYERDVDDAGPANYPPLFYIFLNINNKVYEFGRSVLWNINIKVSAFPSTVYVFFESDSGRIWFNKLIPILLDLGVGYLLYKIVSKFADQKDAVKAAVFYLFLPPSWYISSLWGQIDSAYIFMLLLSILLVIQKKYSWSIFCMAASMLIKPNAIFILPVYLFFILRNAKLLDVIPGLLSSLMIFILPAGYFVGSNNLFLIFQFYQKYVREISGYISSNAFNFWGMIYGFGPNPDSVKLFGLSLFWWGISIYIVILAWTVLMLFKNNTTKQLLYSLLILSFGSFLFLTRMHERYFYISYVLFITSAFTMPKLRKYLLPATAVFFLNLYHYWWYPYFDTLKYLFSYRMTETILCVANLGIYYKIKGFRITKKQ